MSAQPSVIALGDERVLDAKPQFVASTTLSQNHCVILPAPFQGAYKVSEKLLVVLMSLATQEAYKSS